MPRHSAFIALCAALSLVVSAGRTQQPGTGARSFTRALALEDSGYTSANASIGDVNRDGHLDIVLVKGRHWQLRNLVLLGNGNGTFRTPIPVDTVADKSYSGVLVDLDGDGALDMVVSNDRPDPKKVYRNDGTGRFSLVSTFGLPAWNTRHVAVGDVTGDRIPDLVLANRGEDAPSFLCVGAGGGRVMDPCREVSRGSATTISLADVNRDGALDLVVPHRDGGQSYVLINDGKGAFPTRRTFGPPKVTYRSAYAADLDGDGILDITAIDENATATTMRGLPNGAYAEPVAFGPASAPYALGLFDVDGNGRLDIVVGYTRAQPMVFFNDGPGRFTPVTFGDKEGVAYGFAFGDVNKDGFIDIAMARSDARNMLYFGGR